MSDEEYEATQAMLLQAARMIDPLDLNTFRDRIRTADIAGAVIDPAVYRAANKKLQAIDELAAAGIRVKAAFHTLRSQCEHDLKQVAEDP